MCEQYQPVLFKSAFAANIKCTGHFGIALLAANREVLGFLNRSTEINIEANGSDGWYTEGFERQFLDHCCPHWDRPSYV